MPSSPNEPDPAGARWTARASRLAQSPLAITVGVVVAIVVTGLVALPLGVLVVLGSALRQAGRPVLRVLTGTRRGGGAARPLPQR